MPAAAAAEPDDSAAAMPLSVGGDGRLEEPPVVSLYSAWLDRFVRVGEAGELKVCVCVYVCVYVRVWPSSPAPHSLSAATVLIWQVDGEYPWAEESWFTVLRLYIIMIYYVLFKTHTPAAGAPPMSIIYYLSFIMYY